MHEPRGELACKEGGVRVVRVVVRVVSVSGGEVCGVCGVCGVVGGVRHPWLLTTTSPASPLTPHRQNHLHNPRLAPNRDLKARSSAHEARSSELGARLNLVDVQGGGKGGGQRGGFGVHSSFGDAGRLCGAIG